MHRLINPECQPLPASGPKLYLAIDQALKQLNTLATRRDFDHEGWPEHARLWRELLNQSKNRSSREVSPNLLKGDLASPIGIRLDGRHWHSFKKWFDRHVASELLQLAMDSGVPALQAVRLSNRKGGFPDQAESIFYLVFFESEENLPTLIFPQSKESHSLWQKLKFYFSNPNSVSERLSRASEDVAAVDRRWKFGISTVLFGIFLLIFCTFLPMDLRRGILIGYAIILAIIGFWDMDEANRGNTRRAFSRKITFRAN